MGRGGVRTSRRAERVVVAVGAAALAGAAAGIAIALASRPSPSSAPAVAKPLRAEATWAPGTKRAPSFALRDEAGRPLVLPTQRGRTLLVTFLDSVCRQECPLEGRQLGEVSRLLGRARRVELLVVSVDPAEDTPRTARRFIEKAGWHRPWHWLFGTRAQLRRVWRDYGIAVLPMRGDIAHSLVLYAVDAHGFERAGYLFPLAPHTVAADVLRLATAA